MRTAVPLLFTALGCLAQDAQRTCVVVPPKEPHIQIDANSMQVVHGSLVYSNMTEVPVLVVNKNPFKYNYQFTWTSQVMEAAPIEDFLLRLGIPLVAPAATVATAPTVVPAAVAACPLDLVKKVAALESQVKSVRALLTAKLDLAKEVNVFIDSVSGVDLAGECISVYNNAKELRPKIATLASVAEVEQKRTEAQGEFDDLLAKVLADPGCSMSSAMALRFLELP